MKKFILILVLILAAFLVTAQDKNKIVIDESSEKPMLIGPVTRDALSDSSFAWWYDSGYENYEVDLEAIEPVKDKLDDVSITVIMGTWCSDSREQLPRFYKIMDALDFPDQKIEAIAVDRDKEAEGTEVDGLAIDFVPTFIFYKNDSEIGRIIEAPQETLEKDIAGIISN